MTLPSLDAEIVKNSQAWVRQNEGMKVEDPHAYGAPRISSEIADCSMPMTFDQYNYCSLGCLYCFAYLFKKANPAYKNRHLPLKQVNVAQKIAALQGNPQTKQDGLYWEHFYSKKFLWHWGGLADPFCNFESENGTGLQLIDAMGELNYPCLFSFKGAAIFHKKYVKRFEKFSKQRNFAFQVSMVTANDELGKLVEIGVPSPTKRLEALKMLSDMGYWTVLRLRPFIIGVTDLHLEELLERALEAGISAISTEFFALDGRTYENTPRIDWLGKVIGVDNLRKYYSLLSPSPRGAYWRLNRLVKEPYVKKMYTFCKKHNLVLGVSDPDFKELNSSGSCCGMPNKYPANRGLENWTKAQLTYHVRRARKRFHKTGKDQDLTFNSVYGDPRATYLDVPAFAQEHIGLLSRCMSDRTIMTLRLILQETWNNLRSSGNPRNYFDGKVLPVGTDEEGNLIFRYVESPYEVRWKEEGIDLT